MREFKFRFWSKILHTMVKPDDSIFVGAFKDDKIVVMQYTGLHDKNGVEIYEGDIVEGGFEKHRGVITFGMYANPFGSDQWTGYQGFYVKWDKEHADMVRGDTGYWLTNHMETAAVVIGNIYENPELVKEIGGER